MEKTHADGFPNYFDANWTAGRLSPREKRLFNALYHALRYHDQLSPNDTKMMANTIQDVVKSAVGETVA